ncbi:MAG: hypothetical protein Tsb002_03740 [Wenzhouxiangellaceae bacterium]
MPKTPNEEEQTQVSRDDIETARITIWELNMMLWGIAQDDEYIADLLLGRNLDTVLKEGYSHAVRERMRMLEARR